MAIPFYTEDKQHKKRQIESLKNIYDMGGFFKKSITKEIKEMYIEEIISITEKYCPLGPMFCRVADAVLETSENLSKYNFAIEGEDGNVIYFSIDLEFEDWLLEQAARIGTNKIKNGKESFWNNWNISRSTKSVLNNLNVVEEEILILSKGLGKKKALTALQIAQLPEFACKREYIEAVLNYVYRSLGKRRMAECFNNENNEHRVH